MQFLVNAQEMANCDKRTIEYYGIPSMVLMERAALACVEEILSDDYCLDQVGIFCGMGNNGGDGLAVARLLYQKQIPVCVFLLGNEEKATEQTREQLAILRKYSQRIDPKTGKTVITIMEAANWNICLEQQLQHCTLLVDAIFGVGLSREITGHYAEIIYKMNKCSVPKISIDIPSGVDAGNGQVLGCAVIAQKTITFAFCKTGLVLFPGADYAGTIVVKEIGITEESFCQLPQLYTYSTKEILDMLPHRPRHSHKGTFGKVVLVAGSKGMAGAAYLAAKAAYRMGCGLVRIVTPEENREILQTLLPEAILTTYQEGYEPDKIVDALNWGDVIGIGPGLGTSEEATRLLELVLQETNSPLLMDGDALNLLAKKQELAPKSSTGKHQFFDFMERPVVITPHLAEMSRLADCSIIKIQQNLVQTAVDYTQKYSVCCVLKDARTVVTTPKKNAKDREFSCLVGQVYLNLTGNSGMAVGGSGDVLAGMICGLAAQGMELYQAALIGVHLHGCAGDAAASMIGERSMTARDILDQIYSILNEER